jgi:ATP-binding cassette subfamily F protein uup
MDEPTNDLDVETLELLEELLVNYSGTLLLISHDRAFLDNVVTSTWAFEGNGVVREYVGGYEDWLRQRAIAASRSPSFESPKTGGVVPEKAVAEPARRKLSYKEQRELEAIPGQIEALEQEQATLQARLNEADFFVRAPQEAAEAADRLGGIEEELLVLLERWDALGG